MSDGRDYIAELCALVKRAGGVMTLHGKPISEAELRPAMLDSFARRVEMRTIERLVLHSADLGCGR